MLTGQKRWATVASDLDKNLKDIDPDLFRDAVEEQSRARLIEFARGVLAYRTFRRIPRLPEPEIIWSKGTIRLLDHGTKGHFIPH